MALIDWTENLSVGIYSFDEDHKRLISYINQLGDAVKAGKGKDSLEEILDALVDYTIEHFAAEEEAFEKANYPYAAAHKAEHEKLKIKVNQYASEFRAGNTTISLEVLKFLRAWLLDHIKVTDSKYKRYLSE